MIRILDHNLGSTIGDYHPVTTISLYTDLQIESKWNEIGSFSFNTFASELITPEGVLGAKKLDIDSIVYIDGFWGIVTSITTSSDQKTVNVSGTDLMAILQWRVNPYFDAKEMTVANMNTLLAYCFSDGSVTGNGFNVDYSDVSYSWSTYRKVIKDDDATYKTDMFGTVYDTLRDVFARPRSTIRFWVDADYNTHMFRIHIRDVDPAVVSTFSSEEYEISDSVFTRTSDGEVTNYRVAYENTSGADKVAAGYGEEDYTGFARREGTAQYTGQTSKASKVKSFGKKLLKAREDLYDCTLSIPKNKVPDIGAYVVINDFKQGVQIKAQVGLIQGIETNGEMTYLVSFKAYEDLTEICKIEEPESFEYKGTQSYSATQVEDYMVASTTGIVYHEIELYKHPADKGYVKAEDMIGTLTAYSPDRVSDFYFISNSYENSLGGSKAYMDGVEIPIRVYNSAVRFSMEPGNLVSNYNNFDNIPDGLYMETKYTAVPHLGVGETLYIGGNFYWNNVVYNGLVDPPNYGYSSWALTSSLKHLFYKGNIDSTHEITIDRRSSISAVPTWNISFNLVPNNFPLYVSTTATDPLYPGLLYDFSVTNDYSLTSSYILQGSNGVVFTDGNRLNNIDSGATGSFYVGRNQNNMQVRFIAQTEYGLNLNNVVYNFNVYKYNVHDNIASHEAFPGGSVTFNFTDCPPMAYFDHNLSYSGAWNNAGAHFDDNNGTYVATFDIPYTSVGSDTGTLYLKDKDDGYTCYSVASTPVSIVTDMTGGRWVYSANNESIPDTAIYWNTRNNNTRSRAAIRFIPDAPVIAKGFLNADYYDTMSKTTYTYNMVDGVHWDYCDINLGSDRPYTFAGNDNFYFTSADFVSDPLPFYILPWVGNMTNQSLTVGATYTYKPQYRPTTGTRSWSSSNKSVFTVNSATAKNVKITAKAAGTANLVFKYNCNGRWYNLNRSITVS